MDGAHACFFPFQHAPFPNSFSYTTKTSSKASSTPPALHSRPKPERVEGHVSDPQQQASLKQEQASSTQRQRRSQQTKRQQRLETAAARPRPDELNSRAEVSQSSQEVQQEPSETILTFRREGEGWGEAILPQIVFQSRPLETRENLKHRVRSRCSRPAPWQVSSLSGGMRL